MPATERCQRGLLRSKDPSSRPPQVRQQSIALGTAHELRVTCSGKVPPPEAASQVYDIIEAAEHMDESGKAVILGDIYIASCRTWC